ncbi:basement membrane-specific heparan sulfate proteoglycan core protein-like [Clupea harengus]|uniref:Basement membrane-specific heparan sulfate proteoglycan core protein-like n=1 Tax=Clupea harengus TaxID=7950 RepID=A0A6P8F3F2_CLUHA|nr:basement membrane-specific heparan sulfate proteoglycan core protein-like [Clupea harengus]
MDLSAATLLLVCLLYTVAAQAPSLSVEPRSLAAQQGETVSFRCRVLSGTQPVKLEWKKTNNQPLGGNVKTGPDGTVLTISNVQTSNLGSYRCIGTNSQGRGTITASLNIKQSPKVRVTPASPVDLRVGGALSLECHATGKPRPTIKWYRQDGTHETALVATTTTHSSAQYKVAAVSTQHAGTYICRAQNKEGSTDVKVQVRVEGGPSGGALPRATVSVEEIAAVQGQTVTMQCQATGSPTPVISWSKLRSPMPWQHKVVGGTLTLTNVGRQDSGQYICTATNSAGETEAYVQMEVESPPYATSIPDQVTARAGDTLRLQCLAHGSHPIQFQWSRVGGASLPAGARITSEGLLLVGQLSSSDSGVYKCTATNHVGSHEAQARVTVRG